LSECLHVVPTLLPAVILLNGRSIRIGAGSVSDLVWNGMAC
jgi:hypothetical protein